ncbi:MAG: DUF167 domain-containing protein [Rhizobiales bacterium]|nr:DUF167 domain-containing protein [Hyphomicrobiales bacterium]
MGCYRREAEGILLEVRLTPGASRDGLDGVKVLDDGQAVVAARVRAIPDSGAANRALIELLARHFKVGKTSVALVSGATARRKRIRIAGQPDALARIADAWQSLTD